MKASLQRHDSLAIGNWFNLQLLSPPWRSGRWNWKLQHSNHRFGSLGNQTHTYMLSKSHFININSGVIKRNLLWIPRHLYHSYHQGSSKGFRSSVPEGRTKTKYIFLIINHNIKTRNHQVALPFLSSGSSPMIVILKSFSQAHWTQTFFHFLIFSHPLSLILN